MIKPPLIINFTDFWEGFDKSDNFFYRLLSKNYDIQISEEPRFLFYSCYGKEYLNYKCIRIFYASENVRPNFLQCDYALSFDFVKKVNHFRLPLYHIYIDGHRYYENLVRKITIAEAKKTWQKKTKFCCMLVSNPHAKERIEFFHALSNVRKVDSGGRYLNNIGFAIEDKQEFIRDYKFVIAYENSSYPGYTTEKILEPLVANCIPIYWGNPLIENDFNGGAFINANNFRNNDALIKTLVAIDEDDELAIAMLTQKKIPDNGKDHLLVIQEVSNFLIAIIIQNKRLPVANNYFVKCRLLVMAIAKKIENRLIQLSKRN